MDSYIPAIFQGRILEDFLNNKDFLDKSVWAIKLFDVTLDTFSLNGVML